MSQEPAVLSQRFPGQRIFFYKWQRFYSGKRKQASYIFSVLTSSAISPVSAGVGPENAEVIGFGGIGYREFIKFFFFEIRWYS